MMLPSLDRNNPTPLYAQIEHWMRQQIELEIWPARYQLMPETELAQKLGVNRNTVRQAIKILIDQGLLVRHHGKGTFVSSKLVEHSLDEPEITFYDGVIPWSVPSTVRLLHAQVQQPPQHVRDLLELEDGASVFYINRVRSIRDEPVLLLKNYITHHMCPGIEELDFGYESVVNVIQFRFKHRFGVGYRFYEAHAADEEVAQALQLEPGMPVMYIQQLTYTEHKRPVDLGMGWMRPRYLRLNAVIRQTASRSSGVPHFRDSFVPSPADGNSR